MVRVISFTKYFSLLTITCCLQNPFPSIANIPQEKLTDYISKISISKDLAEADSLAKRAFKEAEKHQDLFGKAEIYLSLGEAYYNQAHPTLPKVYFDKAFEIANELNSPILLLKAHRNMARVYNKEGKYHLAIQHFIKSLDIARETNQKAYIFTNYISLAISYNDQNKPNQSLIFSTAAMSDSLSIPKTIKNITISSLYMCMGRSFWLKNQLKSAEHYTSKAIEMASGNDVRIIKTKGWAFSNLGDIYRSEKKYDKALVAYKSAIKTFGLLGGEFGLQRIYIAMAQTYYVQGKYNEALILAKKAYNLAQRINIWIDINDSAKLVSEIYHQKKNFEKAYSYFLVYTNAKDSLKNIESSQRMLELQTRYETKEKENLIGLQQVKILARDTTLAKNRTENRFLYVLIFSTTAILLVLLFAYLKTRKKKNIIQDQQRIIETSNRKLQDQKADLIQVNESKNLLFSIIGHDLIGQVGTTKEFLSLLVNNPDDIKTISEQKNILEALYTTSLSTFSLLENLLLWSKNERGLLSYIPLKQELKPIVEETINLFQFQVQKKNITIELEGNINATASFDRNIITTVLRNLIANAIKFSKVGGIITIKILETQSEVYISVSDTGIGLKPQQVKAITDGKGLISNDGTDNEKGNGIGLTLCLNLVKMHGSALEVKSTDGQGATFTFSLAKKSPTSLYS